MSSPTACSSPVAGPSTAGPSTAHPSTAHPSTAHPSTAHPSTADVSTADVLTADVSTADVSTADPSTVVGRRPNEEQEQDDKPQHVLNGLEDIAESIAGEKIVVGVTGRERAGKIYIRAGHHKGGKTVKKYNVELDVPEHPIPLLPTEEERVGRAGTQQYMVVGIVLAEDPTKYSTKGQGLSRDKGRVEKRKARGTMSPEKNLLRAVVKTTESVDTGASPKYYVACNYLHGLCDLRTATVDTIFFFSEVWEEAGDAKGAKEKQIQIGAACKRMAAKDKTPQQRTTVRVLKKDQTPSNILQITRKANAGNLILMQYSIYLGKKTPEALLALKRTLESVLPDLKSKPADKGILAFHEFGIELAEEDAIDAVNALKIAYPELPSFDATSLMHFHAALRRCGIGGDVPYQNLVLFIRLSHDRALTLPAQDVDNLDKAMDDLVKSVVHDIRIMNEVETYRTVRTASEISNDEKSLVPFVAGLRVALVDIVNFLKDQATGLREQHGGVTSHDSIESIMAKIGDCVDKVALKGLMEQVFAIHAEQLSTGNGNGVIYLEECIALIDEALDIAV